MEGGGKRGMEGKVVFIDPEIGTMGAELQPL